MLKIPDLEKLKKEFSTVAGISGNRIEVYMFPQTWPNTGCGFAQPGYCYGQAFTSDYTVVLIFRRMQSSGTGIIEHNKCCVCFGDRVAYILDDPNDKFWGDLFSFNMSGITEFDKYLKESE